ncbi:MAG: HDOD domain-containing protein [Pseudomonadales bacterium]
MAKAAPKPYVIPSRPEVLIYITDLLQAPEIDVDEVVRTLRQDVSLYSAVIATANTPTFRGKRAISTLNEAVVRLGLKTLFTIVRLAALKNSLSKAGNLERFWDCSTEVANLTVHFAKLSSTESEEDAFSLGMMHNCGIPLLMEAIPNYREFLKNTDTNDLQSLLNEEKALYGSNQFKVSAEIAKRWLLPELVIKAILLQSLTPEQLVNTKAACESSKLLACSLILAKDVSQMFRHYWRIENTQQSMGNLKPLLHFVGIPETDYIDMREDLITLMAQ